MVTGQRQLKRLVAHRLGATSVTIQTPVQLSCTLLDISVAGVKLLFDQEVADEWLQPGSPVKGEIVCNSPQFRLNFTGRIVWKRLTVVVGERASMAGICFAEYTDLPSVLMHLVDDFGQSD